jgi:hypothetical protein
MIPIAAMWHLMMLGVPAAHAQDCAQWGTINPGPDPDSLFINETYVFYASGSQGGVCGDVSTCEWWLDEANAQGELLQSFGSPIEYLSPAELDECTAISFQLFLLCEGASVDAINLTVQCTSDDKADLIAAPGSTVSGGGCTTPSQLFVLLPLLWLPTRRRRGILAEDR